MSREDDRRWEVQRQARQQEERRQEAQREARRLEERRLETRRQDQRLEDRRREQRREDQRREDRREEERREAARRQTLSFFMPSAYTPPAPRPQTPTLKAKVADAVNKADQAATNVVVAVGVLGLLYAAWDVYKQSTPPTEDPNRNS